RLEPQRPRLAGGLPDRARRLDHRRPVRRRPPPRRTRSAGGGSIQHADRMLAVVAGHGAELVEDSLLVRARRQPVALIDRLHVLTLRSRTHDDGFHRPRTVTSQMARRWLAGNISDGA